ncbi:MAG: ABC transporter permease [Alphaproteobacteria bacterium]|nr:ABC transporter permease [Alphaproteobacteria bacterium]
MNEAENKLDNSSLVKRKISAFKKNKRAYVSLFLFLVLFFLSLFSELIANDKPYFLKYDGNLYFPVFKTYNETVFGGDFPTPTNYKDPYILKNIQEKGWMIMPPIPFSFNTVDYEIGRPTPSAPDAKHLLGTDMEGRDILARILYGIRISIFFAFVLTLVSSVIGIFIGAIQGYFGGKIDILLQRFLEIWDSLPQLFILIIISSIFLPTFWSLLFILLLFSWSSLTGMVRAEFLRARNLEFVRAAQALGVSDMRIIYRHILPNAVVTTITFVPFIMSEAIVALTALDFLGLGLSHEYPSLGDLVREGKDNLQSPWIGLSIFIVLSTLLTVLIFIGEGVRDVFDTRKNK